MRKLDALRDQADAISKALAPAMETAKRAAVIVEKAFAELVPIMERAAAAAEQGFVGPAGRELLRRQAEALGREVPTDPHDWRTARWLAVGLFGMRQQDFGLSCPAEIEELAAAVLAGQDYRAAVAKHRKRRPRLPGADEPLFSDLLVAETCRVLQAEPGITRTALARRLGVHRSRLYRDARISKLLGDVDRARSSDRHESPVGRSRDVRKLLDAKRRLRDPS